MLHTAILGATGAVGSVLAPHLLRSGLLSAGDRLSLVGHGTPSTEQRLLAERIDLLDAFDDQQIDSDVVPDVDQVEADIVVVAAGQTVSPEHPTRQDLARINRPVFERIADLCVARLPHGLFIVVSNPVELGVYILARRIKRHRVVGMGAQQDSLRFARAIATDLDISRHDVRASVIGEHGQRMVPLWDSVELLVDARACREKLQALRQAASETDLQQRVTRLREETDRLLAEERIADAYEVVRCALPDARIFLEPFVTAHCMHSTPQATANATLQLIAAVLATDRRLVHGQVALQGEAFGIQGVYGVPITLSRSGWRVAEAVRPDDRLAAVITEGAKAVQAFIDEVLAA